MVRFTSRESYTVKELMTDLKKISPSPQTLRKIGTQLIYTQWNQCAHLLGTDHPVTSNFSDMLKFMKEGYEEQLVNGEIWRAADTPTSAINRFLKGRPKEFMTFVIERPVDYIRGLLEDADKSRKAEIKRYKKVLKFVKKEVKASPDDPMVYNKMRLLLWIVGSYAESSTAFKTAKKLGWTVEESRLVAL
ncbi:MAG: hypothetical protein ACTSU3_04705 [Candidatus Thorarchaeota archaeon]